MEGNSEQYFPLMGATYDVDYFPVPLLKSRPATVQKSTAVVPSTTREWNAQRSVISRLYQDMDLPLKEVQRIMEKDFNFTAPKRMYNTRLKQWDLRKNYRAEEKEALAAKIAQAHLDNRSVSNLTFKDLPIKLNRVLRHLRTKRRATTTPKSDQEPRLADEEDQSFSDSGTSADSQNKRGRITPTTNDRSNTIIPKSWTTTSTLQTPPSGSDENVDDCEIIERDDKDEAIPDTAPPLSPPKVSTNMKLILHQTQAYYRYRLNSLDSTFIDTQHCTSIFWENIKSGIYFL